MQVNKGDLPKIVDGKFVGGKLPNIIEGTETMPLKVVCPKDGKPKGCIGCALLCTYAGWCFKPRHKTSDIFAETIKEGVKDALVEYEQERKSDQEKTLSHEQTSGQDLAKTKHRGTKTGIQNYREVFLLGWQRSIEKYVSGEYRLFSESDLRCFLFHECVDIMKKNDFEKPYQIFTEKSILNRRQKTDLVLGNEVAAEIKFEADYPGVSKPVVFREEVEKDINRLSAFINKGYRNAFFIMIDEDGTHMRNPRIKENWKEINVKGKRKNAFYLSVERQK